MITAVVTVISVQAELAGRLANHRLRQLEGCPDRPRSEVQLEAEHDDRTFRKLSCISGRRTKCLSPLFLSS